MTDLSSYGPRRRIRGGPGARGPQYGAGRYPFGVGARRLGRILDSLGVGAGKGGRGRRSGTIRMRAANVWLPTRANGSPIPSSGMIDGYASRPSGARRVPWVVDAAELSEGGAADILGRIMGSRAVEYDAGSSIIIGSDLAYMAESARLAGLIVAGQQYLPHIEPVPGAEGGGWWYEVSWNPVITAEYSEQFESLSGRMPGAVRAITKTRDAGAGRKGGRGGRAGAPSYRTDGPRNPPQAVLLRFVRRMVDHLVRDSVSAGARAPAAGPGFDSAHDAWMHHLRSPEPTEISGPDVRRLHEQVEEWQRPVSLQARSPLRLCFRLEEPAGSDDAWLIRYLLQPRSDPSLLVPADKAWNARSSAVALPRGVNAKEALLTSLGQASRIMPALTDGLDAAGGGGGGGGASMRGYATDTDGAYRFLTREAAALRQAGYGVILPAWWTGRGSKARIRAQANVRAPRMKARGLFDFRSVVSFDWKVAIGDQEMTLGELRDLARAKAPLVRMRGEWAEVSPEDIRQAVRFLQKGGGSGRAPFLDVIRMGAGAAGVPGGGGGSGGGIDVEVTSRDGHVRRILDQLADKTKLRDLAQPAGFSGTLRPYQLRGFSWMAFLQRWGLGGCLADDMGLGKTIQVLALIQRHARQSAGSRKPFLLVCPTSVIGNWKREAGRFTPGLDVAVHHGADRARGAAAFRRMAGGHDVVVSSYGLLHRDLKAFRDAGWGGIVLDEAQNIKNPNTKQAQAARAVGADCRFALTGTPVENNVGDLWSIMEFLNPGLLGGQSSFKRDFFVPIQMLQDAGAAERLKTATGPFVLRRLKTDRSIISDLPEKVETKTYCQLTREQATLYEAVIEDVGGVLGMDGGGGGGRPGAAGRGPRRGESDVSAFRRKGLILAALTKLKQACDHPAVLLKDNSQSSGGGGGGARSGKLMRLTEMLSEVTEAGDSALVFTQFVEMGRIIRDHLQGALGRETLFLHGGTPRSQRDAMIERFQEGHDDGAGGGGGGKGPKNGKNPESGGGGGKGGRAVEPKIFVISLRAGGTGLNLTAASHVFHFDRGWNPAVEDQATDRAFRIGQRRNVQVHKMICSGTLEERIDDTIEMKKGVSEMVVGAGENWLTEMSNEDLRSILALSADATMAAEDS